eukprot:9396310-Heterocapsa_arctica.AAC.1
MNPSNERDGGEGGERVGGDSGGHGVYGDRTRAALDLQRGAELVRRLRAEELRGVRDDARRRYLR